MLKFREIHSTFTQGNSALHVAPVVASGIEKAANKD